MTLHPTALVIAALLPGCWTSSKNTSDTGSDGARLTNVSVELAAVTLGEDCGDGWKPQPPVFRAQAPSRTPATPSAVAAMEPPADEAEGAPHRRWECEQTSMQLSLVASAGTQPATIRIKRVQFLDDHGKVLGALDARPGTRWASDRYQAWDQTIAPGQRLAASYVLSSPNWHELEGGQWAQRGKMFQVRVTLEIGSREQTVEKQAISPAIMEPAVPT